MIDRYSDRKSIFSLYPRMNTQKSMNTPVTIKSVFRPKNARMLGKLVLEGGANISLTKEQADQFKPHVERKMTVAQIRRLLEEAKPSN